MSLSLILMFCCVGGIVFIISTYNNFIRLRQETDESYAAIETELKRRYDLIPNLVEIVKGYATHEKETLESVISARNGVANSNDLDSHIKSQNVLTEALHKFAVVVESYPQLKANENFHDLMTQLNETETQIAQSRRFYNAVVRDYNTAANSFPTLLIARSFGFNPKPYFGIENHEAFEPTKISFNQASEIINNSKKIKIEDKADNL